MLHPTNLPDCAHLLERVLDFQERLLELGCSRPEVTPDDFRHVLGEDAFAWLGSTNATNGLYTPIYAFARLPQAEKDGILEDFRHDRQYIQHLNDPNFQFRLLGDTDDENRRRIKSWLVNFYVQFTKASGIGGAVTGSGVLNKDAWWQAYSHGNGGRLTCAVCDGTMNHTITVEHYLPKGRYPALALHPHNLIPACDKCNEKIKGEQDPLDGGSFLSVFMPYREAIRDVAHLEFEESQEGAVQVHIVPNNDDPMDDEKVSSLSELFDLPGQWQRNIHEIGEIACRRVRQHFRSLRDAGIEQPPEKLPEQLDKVCGYMEQDWGIEHYGYPATEWLRWVSANKSENLLAEVAAS